AIASTYQINIFILIYFFFQAEDGIRDGHVTGVQTCALPICRRRRGCADRLGEPVTLPELHPGDQRDRAAADPVEQRHHLRHRGRSEERRVGKECRCWWGGYLEKVNRLIINVVRYIWK